MDYVENCMENWRRALGGVGAEPASSGCDQESGGRAHDNSLLTRPVSSTLGGVLNTSLHGPRASRGVLCELVTQGCLTLCNPMACSPPGSSVHGMLQASTLEWVAMPSSRGSSPGTEPRSLAWQADSLPSEPPGKPLSSSTVWC